MRIDIRHRFEGATLREVEQLYLLDDDFNRATFERLGFGRKVVLRREQGSVFERELHLRPHHALPAPFGALAPASLFHISEYIQYDFALRQGTWRTTPSVLSKQFLASGTLAFVEQEGAVHFVLEGDARATIPLLSTRAERQAVSSAEAQHEALARAVREHLDVARQITSYHVASA